MHFPSVLFFNRNTMHTNPPITTSLCYARPKMCKTKRRGSIYPFWSYHICNDSCLILCPSPWCQNVCKTTRHSLCLHFFSRNQSNPSIPTILPGVFGLRKRSLENVNSRVQPFQTHPRWCHPRSWRGGSAPTSVWYHRSIDPSARCWAPLLVLRARKILRV